MTIGNIQIPAIPAPEGIRGDRRTEPVRPSVGRPVSDTGDLLALSTCVGFKGVVEGESVEREALVLSLAAAIKARTYRPDSVRTADKLLAWGFDVGAAEQR